MWLCLCPFSALLLEILYLFFGSFPLVFRVNHGFGLWQIGLTFIGLMVGMLVGLSTNLIWHRKYIRLVFRSRKAASDEQLRPDPQFRLPPGTPGAFGIPVGIFVRSATYTMLNRRADLKIQWFGWKSYSWVHWIVRIVGSSFVGLG